VDATQLISVLIAIALLAAAATALVTVRRGRLRLPEQQPPQDQPSTRGPDQPATQTATQPATEPAGQAPPRSPAGAPAGPVELAEPETDSAEDAATAPPVERPEPAAGRLVRLRARLARSNGTLGQGLLSLLSRDRLDAGTWDEIEDTLLLADVGAGPAGQLVDALRQRVAVLGTRDADTVRELLRGELLAALNPDLDRSLRLTGHPDRPAVVLVVGVNGTGKTTTVGKLARILVADHRTVLLGAADTFRAAAADQLQTWGQRVGVNTVRSDREGADPASVAFEAVSTGIEQRVDVVLIDTAGRLQNKVGLMDELGKVKRVVQKHGPVDEVLLVLDATTGQNGMQQARVFTEVVDVTGIVLTKLDGTAKGGIVIAVQRELGVPVKLVGLGEGLDDLAPFDPAGFVDALIS
jgi:fused signal recognition particle receptor